MQTGCRAGRAWMTMTLAAAALAAWAVTALAADADPRDDASPWGVASGAEWSGDYAGFNPLLRDAGVRWMRYFAEWQSVQPRQGEWNWDWQDRFMASANSNGIHVTGVFAYFAKWASADGGTRKCPIRDIQYWRDYVGGAVTRYRKDIKYWEVWNEFNGSFSVNGTPKLYADLVIAAHESARLADPTARIGISCANFDVGWLDAAIKAGAADHFDYVCVHPYENLGAAMQGGEPGYLSLAASLRRMLAANKQRADIPLWITETGHQAPVLPDAKGDAEQAEALAKVYVLSTAQGFQRVCWFEARGPAYGKGTDHGLIRRDWTRRPALEALKTMTRLMGAEPQYLGWLKLGSNGYGFVYRGAEAAVLAAWSPPEAANMVTFSAPVRVVDLAGRTTPIEAGKPLALSRTPVFVVGLPKQETEQATSQAQMPFPWGTDYSQAQEVTCRLGAINDEKGIKQTRPETTVVVNDLTESWRRANFSAGGEGRYMYFRVDPTFAPFGTTNLEITVVARRAAADKPANTGLLYESLKGYRAAQGHFDIPADNGWHEYTWKVNNANFVGGWGWNFRTEATGSPSEFCVREVRVRKP